MGLTQPLREIFARKSIYRFAVEWIRDDFLPRTAGGGVSAAEALRAGGRDTVADVELSAAAWVLVHVVGLGFKYNDKIMGHRLREISPLARGSQDAEAGLKNIHIHVVQITSGSEFFFKKLTPTIMTKARTKFSHFFLSLDAFLMLQVWLMLGGIVHCTYYVRLARQYAWSETLDFLVLYIWPKAIRQAIWEMFPRSKCGIPFLLSPLFETFDRRISRRWWNWGRGRLRRRTRTRGSGASFAMEASSSPAYLDSSWHSHFVTSFHFLSVIIVTLFT